MGHVVPINQKDKNNPKSFDAVLTSRPQANYVTRQFCTFHLSLSISISLFLSLPISLIEANPGLFLIYVHSFQAKIVQKNSRHQRDSNSDRRCWSRACWPLDHQHGPIFNVWFSIYFRHSIFPSLSLCLPLSTYLSLMFDFLSFFISIFIFLCLVKNLYLFLQYLKFMYNFISFYLSLSYMHLYIYTSFSPLRHTQPQNKNKL